MVIGALLFAVLLLGLSGTGQAALNAQEIYARTNPSVVTVVHNAGSGSGFAVGRKGYIATNYHVIEGQRARAIKVRLASGKKLKVKKIIVADKEHDLALLQVNSPPNSLLPLSLWVDDIPVGSEVAVIGTPLGFSSTITTGVVSAIRGECLVGKGYKKTVSTCYQTSAAINKGNSGGPLLNSKGIVIGINTFIVRKDGAEGLGFSVHASHLADLMRSKGIPAPIRSGSGRDVQLPDSNQAQSTIETKTLPKGSYKSVSDEIDRELKQAALEKERVKKNSERKDHAGERHRQLRNPRALFKAVMQGDMETVESELRMGVDVNGKYNGMTPLMVAAINNQPQMIRTLSSQGASPLIVDGMRQTALIHASKLGKVESVRALLKSHAMLDQLDKDGRSALMHSAIFGSKEVVEELIHAGADYSLTDFSGNTAEELASIHSHSGISVYLFKVKYQAEKEADRNKH